MAQRWWVVEGCAELLGVTTDLAVAQRKLREKAMADRLVEKADELFFDIKFGDWYLFSSATRQCLWDYSARRTEEL